MCGIGGFIDYGNELTQQDLEVMNKILSHRGPDDSGTFNDNNINFNIGLAHTRLSIIDLSKSGSQPMISLNKQVILTFNGEIYNYKELRKELIAFGYVFNSNSDTEVIINSYLYWGIDCINKFIGMFSFVLYDKKELKLYLVRDRFGVKPLYYFQNDKSLLFASELKALLSNKRISKTLNPLAISEYLRLFYVPDNLTIFNSFYKVPKGCIIRFDIINKKKDLIKYWNTETKIISNLTIRNEEEYINEIEDLLINSLRRRFVSDVPVGVFLSGGIDSSLITALSQKALGTNVKTFTVGFHNKEFDESFHAKQIAEYLETEHHEIIFDSNNLLELIPDLVEVFDEPFADNSSSPTYLLSKFTREHVKVALSGDGGDELFGGYVSMYSAINLHNKIKSSPLGYYILGSNIGYLLSRTNSYLNSFMLQNKIDKLSYALSEKSSYDYMKKHTWRLTDINLKKILKKEFIIEGSSGGKNKDITLEKGILDYYVNEYLVGDILVKTDRLTMSVGLEGREPLLDHMLFEYLQNVPVNLRFHPKEPKYILKKILAKYIPRKLWDRPKKGFSMPIIHWLTDNNNLILNEYLGPTNINQIEFLNYDGIMQMKKEFLHSKNKKLGYNLWSLIILILWYNRWMK